MEVTAEEGAGDVLRVKNRYWFSSLADITLKVSVKTDGRQVASYEFKLPHLQPGESEDMHLPVLALGQGKR